MGLRNRKVPAEEKDNKIIEINAQMQGTLVFKDPVNLKINGDFNGSLDVRGTLTIGEKANIVANISGENIIVAGHVKGDIVADKMLVFMPTAVVEGNIKTPKLNIVEGAIFHGHCSMGSNDEQQYSDMMDIDEVARYLEIDEQEIINLVNAGKIPAEKIGDSWRFERSQIDAWAASGRV